MRRLEFLREQSRDQRVAFQLEFAVCICIFTVGRERACLFLSQCLPACIFIHKRSFHFVVTIVFLLLQQALRLLAKSSKKNEENKYKIVQSLSVSFLHRVVRTVCLAIPKFNVVIVIKLFLSYSFLSSSLSATRVCVGVKNSNLNSQCSRYRNICIV